MSSKTLLTSSPKIADSPLPSLASVSYTHLDVYKRQIEDSMVEQLTYLAKLDGKVDAEEQKQLDEAETVRKQIKQIASSKHDDTLYLGMTRAYLMDLATYDPVKTAEKIQVPVLLCQGLRDYQVTKTDLKRWQQAFAEKANWTIRTYATANHAMSKGCLLYTSLG